MLIQQLLSENNDFLKNDNGWNIIIVRPENFISKEDPDGMIHARQYADAVMHYATRKKGLIVSDLPPAVSPFFNGDTDAVEKLISWWKQNLKSVKEVYILDFSCVIKEIGFQNARDASLEAAARTPYTPLVYQRLGIAATRLLRGTCIPPKKVIALDCDNTLWGGVAGEDGINNLSISNDYPGRAFRLFQEKLLELKNKGILLVLVSKNEEPDVWNVFENHPGMILHKSDIAAYRINWKAKSSNLRELAVELNLGLDSFVFADDSPAERLEVEINAPEVTVLPMPEDTSDYSEMLSSLFTTVHFFE
ncbi:MAG: HAD-IIIC family phosphatase [Desulfobacteraceae bacterium]|nr:HAD-IIIC family phosphatase [Desulfobacteraceae bacterium]